LACDGDLIACDRRDSDLRLTSTQAFDINQKLESAGAVKKGATSVVFQQVTAG
jgi:hypothetical protein